MRSTELAHHALFPLSAVLLAIACGSPPKAAPPPVSPPAASSVAVTPPPVGEEPLAPGEVRCGIDDGPVPIGRREDDLRRESADPFALARPLDNVDAAVVAKRMMIEDVDMPPMVDAAKAHAAMSFTLGQGLSRVPAFEDRAHACRDLADVDDAGSRVFSVRVAASGSPLSVTPVGSRPQTKYAACLATSLCSLGAQTQGSPARKIEARVDTRITPPVFTGTVSITFRGDRSGAPSARGPMAPGLSRRGRRAPPPPEPPLTAADRAYVEKMVKAAQPGALACAKRTPPNGTLFVGTGALAPLPPASAYKKVDMAMPPPPPQVAQAAQAYHAAMTTCFIDAVRTVLMAPPKSYSTTGKVFATAQYVPGPEAPPPPVP